MNCRDVESSLIKHEESAATQLPEEVQQHILTCDRCREFIRALSPSVPADGPSPELLRQLRGTLTAELRPVRPLAQARYFLAGFAAIFLLLVAVGAYRSGTQAISVMRPGQSIAIFGVLFPCAALLVYSLVNQMAPGRRQWTSPTLLPVAVISLLLVVIAALFRFQPEHDFWSNGRACLTAGGPLALLAAIPFWLLLRKGAILSPRVTGATAGLLAGLVTTSAQEIYCPILDVSHILTWHFGVALMGALVGWGAGYTGEAAVKHLRSATR